MINIRLIVVIAIAMSMFTCNTKRQACDTTNFKELSLYPVNTVLKLPAYIIDDTIRYGDLSNIFEYKVKSTDSSIIVYAGVKSYEQNPDAMPDINHRMGSQKEQVESGQDSMRLIVETFETIGTTKVGYLKYLDKKRKRYEGRIFFYRGNKFVDIWLFEGYTNEAKNKQSVIDCVLENIEIH
jgi:hypothetical protein